MVAFRADQFDEAAEIVSTTAVHILSIARTLVLRRVPGQAANGSEHRAVEYH
jgi:hypothetical protein